MLLIELLEAVPGSALILVRGELLAEAAARAIGGGGEGTQRPTTP